MIGPDLLAPFVLVLYPAPELNITSGLMSKRRHGHIWKEKGLDRIEHTLDGVYTRFTGRDHRLGRIVLHSGKRLVTRRSYQHEKVAGAEKIKTQVGNHR